jgi:GNAT superfamily N-acetyltransferase
MILELSLSEALKKFAKEESEIRFLSFPFQFERVHFIAIENGKSIGRISANRSLRDPDRGYIGMFECDPSLKNAQNTAASLIGSAEKWLTGRGVKKAYGPVNYSTMFSYRFELPRSSQPSVPSFFWEPTQPPDYLHWFRAAGYSVADEYFSRAFENLHLIVPKSQHRYEEALRLGYSTRALDFSKNPGHELSMLSQINAGSFEESFLAEPFDEKAYRELVAPQFFKVLSEFSFFILNPKGQEIGYFFLFPENGYLVWKTIAILPKYQKAGLAGFGIHHALLLCEKHGIRKVIAALIRKGAPSEVLLKRAESFLLWEHRYAVLEKLL